jgi:hypothetical protein
MNWVRAFGTKIAKHFLRVSLVIIQLSIQKITKLKGRERSPERSPKEVTGYIGNKKLTIGCIE